jgi:hypothetical protein
VAQPGPPDRIERRQPDPPLLATSRAEARFFLATAADVRFGRGPWGLSAVVRTRNFGVDR